MESSDSVWTDWSRHRLMSVVRLPHAEVLHRRVVLGVAVVVLATALFAIGPWPVGVFYDDGIYLILGKSLASGEGLRYLNLPGRPAATHYPPGYPVLLAMLWKLAPSFPANVGLFKVANAILLSIGCAGLAHFATVRMKLNSLVAAATVVAFGISIPVLSMAGVLFSEPLFLAVLAPTLLLSERAVEEPEKAHRLILAGILCGILTLVRTIGVATVGAVILALIVRRRRTAAATFVAAAVTVLLPWQIWVTAHTSEVPAVLQGSYGSYLGWFLDAFRERGVSFAFTVGAHNAAEITRPIGALFSIIAAAPVRLLVVATVIATFALGFWRTVGLAPVCAGFVAGYLAIVLVWPYVPDRFLWGVWPVLGLVLVSGVVALADWRGVSQPTHALRLAALVVMTFAGVSFTRYNVRGFSHRWWESAQRGSADALAPLVRWASLNTRVTDVLASDGDPMVYLYTGRTTVPAISWSASEYIVHQNDTRAAVNLRALLDEFGVRYVMLGGGSSPAANAAHALTKSMPPVLTLQQALPEGGAVFSMSPK